MPLLYGLLMGYAMSYNAMVQKYFDIVLGNQTKNEESVQ